MKIIARNRRCGKTTEVIKLANEKDAYIVCASKQRVRMLMEEAQEKPKRFPVTWDELKQMRGAHPDAKRFVVDDADDVLRLAMWDACGPLECYGMSMTDEEAPIPIPASTICGVAESVVNKVSRHHTAMMERFLEGFLSAEVVKQHATDPMKAAMLISETVRTHELCMDYDQEKGVARYWIRNKDKDLQP